MKRRGGLALCCQVLEHWLLEVLPAAFALTLAGSALSVLTNPIAAVITGVGSLIGHEKPSKTDTGAYSYLFSARHRFGGY